MAAYRDDKRKGRKPRWRYRKQLTFPDGSTKRIQGTSPRNTKAANAAAEAEHVERELKAFYERKLAPESAKVEEKEVPTFDEWFHGRFWREWVVAEKNSAGEKEAKESVYRVHLSEPLGKLRLDEIDVGVIANLRATLLEKEARPGKPLSPKRINNILAVVSKALRYAAEVRLIPYVPRIGLLKTERPEIEWWELEQYGRMLAAARVDDPEWYVAILLAGDAGLRKGEIRGLRYREDLDLVAGTLTVRQQIRTVKRVDSIGPPKGRRRRTVPMTERLLSAIKGLSQIRTGYVVRNLDGSHKTDSAMTTTLYRICRRAGLPERQWHCLRHTFGTHGALFGVNPWRLQAWLGHQRIDETMRYVHVASDHMRPLPACLTQVHEVDPDRRILAMLGLRGSEMAKQNGDVVPTSRGVCEKPRLVSNLEATPTGFEPR